MSSVINVGMDGWNLTYNERDGFYKLFHNHLEESLYFNEEELNKIQTLINEQKKIKKISKNGHNVGQD